MPSLHMKSTHYNIHVYIICSGVSTVDDKEGCRTKETRDEGTCSLNFVMKSTEMLNPRHV